MLIANIFVTIVHTLLGVHFLLQKCTAVMNHPGTSQAHIVEEDGKCIKHKCKRLVKGSLLRK